MKLEAWLGLDRMMFPWYPRKKNNLSRFMGPPKVPPNWLRLSESRVVAKSFWH
jgi:hypothetical protein